MNSILLNIDSKYRDILMYPNESKFNLIFEKVYKNIISVKLVTFEINNILSFINFISSEKKNNYFTIHLPNKINDPDGTIIYLDDGHTHDIKILINNINLKLSTIFNNNSLLSNEKYFYFFYLLNNTDIIFNFNDTIKILTINIGWNSVYGIYKQMEQFITDCDLKNTNITINNFTFNVFDRRYNNNIRQDTIILPNIINLDSLKIDLYNNYINPSNFNIFTSQQSNSILYNLFSEYSSLYHINNTNAVDINSIQICNLSLNINNDIFKIYFKNSINNFYYYNNNSWTSISGLNDSLEKDILSFEIDFNTNSNNNSNINKLNYLSLGYYLGFRLNFNNNNLLSSKFYNNKTILEATKVYNIKSNNYIFLKMNDWGYIDFNNKTIFSKIMFLNCIHNNKIDYYINLEYNFQQPINIQKFDIEIFDYLGNSMDLNGSDFSFTLQLTEILNTDLKNSTEKKHLFFN